MCLTMQSFKTLFKSDDLLAEGLMTFKVISFNLLKLRINFHFQLLDSMVNEIAHLLRTQHFPKT